MSGDGEKIKGFLINPVETFRKQSGEHLGAAYRYYVVLLVLFSVLYGIVAIALDMSVFNTTIASLGSIPGMEWAAYLASFGAFAVSFDIFFIYVMFFISLFSIFISGLMLHCFVLLLGGEKGYSQTIKSMMYAYTPYLLFGWIPYVNIIVAVWMLALQVIGIRELQEMQTEHAVLVVLLPAFLVFFGFLLFGIVIATFLSGFAGMLGFA